MLVYDSNSPASRLAKVFLDGASSGLLIITGPRGAGKTAFCAHLAGLARQAGLSVGGLLCPAVFSGSVKAGIDQVDLGSGKCRRLGWRSLDSSNNTVGCWRMDGCVIEWGNEICTALGDEDLIIIDEIGPLELEAGAGYQQALQLVDEGRYRTALVVVRPACLPLAQARWPNARVLNLPGASV